MTTRCYTDGDFIRRLGEIDGFVNRALECVKIAHRDGLHPHEIIGIQRDARETVEHYFDALETVLHQRIKRGLVKITGPEYSNPLPLNKQPQ